MKQTTESQKEVLVQTVTADQKENAASGDSFQPSLSVNYEFNLSDFILFMAVMKVQKAYEDMLSIILDETDLRLKEVKAEQVVLNKSGKRAIRLDAWALDIRDRQFDMEMQNDTDGDDVRKRSRFYQSLIDTPILKSGKETRYKHLPSTTIIFITQEDIFGKDLAMYTFRERCEEIPDLSLDDGTSKIFLNMTSKNGRPELISLLQYMKRTTLDNENIIVRDDRILDLDRIVREVRQSEEWEDVRMNFLEFGISQGERIGLTKGLSKGLSKGKEIGRLEELTKNIEAAMQNFHVNLPQACKGLNSSVEEYEQAKEKLLLFEKKTKEKADGEASEENVDNNEDEVEFGTGFWRYFEE